MPTLESSRINCRVSAEIKRQAEEAAGLLGQSITAFTEAALAEKADHVLSRIQRLDLSKHDFGLFLKAIDNPPAPPPKLQEAAAAYGKMRKRNPQSNW